MGVVNTTYTFTSTDTITSAKMNNIIDDTTFTSDAISGSTLQIVSPGKLAIAAGGITTNELSNNVAISLIPSGAIMAFAVSTAPLGWLSANGDIVPNGSGTVQGRTADFASLYALLGTTYGAAGALPDLRGIFVRGSGSQVISGGTFAGTFAQKQAHMFQDHGHAGYTNSAGWHAHSGWTDVQGSHNHSYQWFPGEGNGEIDNNYQAGHNQATGYTSTDGAHSHNVGTHGAGDHTHTIQTYGANSGTTGGETRPANIALLYCIKI
jgi:microcystin-dependent protein